MIERNAPGYAIGGLAGGETKDMFWRVVAQCAAGLPPGKPRYVMGIGYPLDVVVCSALGADMYDSVYPTRTARFGVALVDTGGCRTAAGWRDWHAKRKCKTDNHTTVVFHWVPALQPRPVCLRHI